MKRLKNKVTYLFAVFLLIGFHSIYAQNNPEILYDISFLEDREGKLTINTISDKVFKPLDSNSPNYNLTKSVYWFKIRLINHTDAEKFLLKIHNGSITNVSFYTFQNNKINVQSISNTTPFAQRKFNSQYPLFNINLPADSDTICLLRISSINVMDIPISIDRDIAILDAISLDQWYFGLYAGIILVMFLYNVFIYLTVRDKNYLYYVFYILVVGLTQACLKGYAPKFFWSDNPWLIKEAPHIITSLSGIFSIIFTFNFLQVKKHASRIFYILWATIIVYFISIAIFLSGQYILAQQILQINTGLVSITILFCGFYIYKKGYKPALFFNVSWSFFLIGVIIYILKDTGVLPFNSFTNNAILIGSGLEVALLSFALADKINIYKKEKEVSQKETLKALKENQRIIRDQNFVLENKVKERTTELIASNEELNKTLVDLKEAEIQLVESEKMASLGQLTAGIAHEINNPVNFITGNINPLKRDVDILFGIIHTIENVGLSEALTEEKQRQINAYKEEMDFDYLKLEIGHLLNGINEGASRTAEIVKGLRIFSRLDEDDLKLADVNEALDSTLIIINNMLGNNIQVIKKYGAISRIECYPGKLNQVFLNIISNAIYAIKKQHHNTAGGILEITTSSNENTVTIKLKDNGTGMDDNTKRKIFEPFFTTKDVGEGTGLGMSIVYNTIKKHNGIILINSEPGMGTEFILELPEKHNVLINV